VVDVSRKTDETMLLQVVTFGETAEQLLRHCKGDSLLVFGKVQMSSWTTKEQVEEARLQILAATIVRVRSVGP
jgi:single-stranded DNA-binding protein